jgi:hypothetical protein
MPVDVAQLKELKTLLDEGVLNQAEFDEQKSAMLAKGNQVAPEPIAPVPVPVATVQNSNSMVSENKNNIVIQNNSGGGNTKPYKYEASMLAGPWTRPGDDCCIPPAQYMITPMGEDAFQVSGTGRYSAQKFMYTRSGSTDNFQANLPGGVRMCLILNENDLRMSGGGPALPDSTMTKNVPTQLANPNNTAPQPQIIQQ